MLTHAITDGNPAPKVFHDSFGKASFPTAVKTMLLPDDVSPANVQWFSPYTKEERKMIHNALVRQAELEAEVENERLRLIAYHEKQIEIHQQMVQQREAQEHALEIVQLQQAELREWQEENLAWVNQNLVTQAEKK